LHSVDAFVRHTRNVIGRCSDVGVLLTFDVAEDDWKVDACVLIVLVVVVL